MTLITEPVEPPTHSLMFLGKVCTTANAIDTRQIEAMADKLSELRQSGGRLFVLGLGGSAANASHAVNDFSKLCGIHAYAPTDNAAEMTARINDEGWDQWLEEWLADRSLRSDDAILILSVGGGSESPAVSVPLVRAAKLAGDCGATILGIVGRDGGYTMKAADVTVHIPPIDPDLVTPLAESFQSVVLHSLVSHPKLAVQKAKWEGMSTGPPKYITESAIPIIWSMPELSPSILEQP